MLMLAQCNVSGRYTGEDSGLGVNPDNVMTLYPLPKSPGERHPAPVLHSPCDIGLPVFPALSDTRPQPDTTQVSPGWGQRVGSATGRT